MQTTASPPGPAHDTTAAHGLKVAPLEDRSIVRVGGPDAQHLLQGLVTQDLDLLDRQTAVYAGLLSPQGKILFDFFVVRAGEGLLLDVASPKSAELIKRLTLYRLRAKVTFAVADELAVLAVWGEGVLPAAPEAVIYPDPRLAALGWRVILPVARVADWTNPGVAPDMIEAWHAHRIALGVPEGGRDFPFGDTFPHEADMDQLAGVSFSKGCYVGQEVVSRMQHRGTARKRFVQVTGLGTLTSGTAIVAGTASIGSIASVDGTRGLALLRLDRAAEAKAKGEALRAGDVAIEVVKPAWATFDLTPPAREASHDL